MIKKSYLFLTLLTALLWLGSGTMWGEDLTLTVMGDDTSNQFVPVDGYNLDGAQHNQLLFLSSELSAMNGGTIKELKFYFNRTGHSWNNSSIPTMVVRLKEVENSSITSLVSVDGSTQVYSGAINFDFTNKLFTVTFDDAYSYGGGNLLIDIQTTPNSSNYVRKSNNSYNMRYYGSQVSGRALFGSTAQGVCPKTTFTYEEAAVVGGCNKPKNLTKSVDLPDGATFTWEQNADETIYQWACVASGEEVTIWNTLAENIHTYTITDLSAGTAYDFCVRSYCGDGENEQSELVKKTFTPVCPAPMYPSNPVTAKTATTATIAWNAIDGMTKYQYVCVAKNATPSWSNPSETAGTSANLTGLAAYTEYDFYVRSWYSANAISEAVKTTFRTECAAVNAPYAWDFEEVTAGAAPGCWDNSASTAVPGWGSDDYNWTVYSYSSKKFLRMNNTSLKSGGISLINTPSIVLPASPAQELVFDYSHRASCGNFIVKISSDGGATFTDLQSYGNTASSSSYDPGTYTEASISLASYANQTIILQFYAVADYDAGAIFVDNVKLQNAASCPKPTGLEYSEKAAHSVKLSWTSTAEAWKVEYAENSDFNPSSFKNAAENPYVLEDLEANTHYYVRVLADCGTDGESQPTAAIDFTTKCEDATLPMTEGFEGGALPECWTAAAQWAIYAYSSGHNSSTSMRFNASTSSDLTLRDIYLAEAAQLSFWRQSSYVSCGVYINDGSGLTQLGNNFAKSSSWKKDSVDLSAYAGKTVTLVIRGNYYGSGRYLYIDDIAVTYAPVAAPANVEATPGDASATITWDNAANTTWNLRYREQNAEPEANWTVVPAAENSKELEGLTNGTTYEVQVQAVCSENRKSDWTASATFSPVACATVTSVSYGAQTYNSIVVNWTASAAGTWAVHYKTASETEWTSAGTGLTEATKTLTGLATGVAYTVEVKAACGEAWVAGEAFTLVYSAPASASVTGATDAAASASWSAVADADSYQYIVLASGEPNWDNATPAAENSASLSGLNAGTAYTLYVRSVYSTGFSEAITANFSTTTIAPQNLQQDGESTATTASFKWEANGAATQYQWSIDNSNWSEPITALTATADGLNSGADYTFYVRSYYSENVQSAAISLPFQTQCGTIAVGYTQNFDAAAALPACWESTNFGSGNNKWNIGMDWYECKSSWNSARFYAYKNSGSATADLITPAIELTEPTLLKFFYKNESGVTAKVLIRISGEEDAEIWTASTKGNWAADPESIDLTDYVGKTAKLIFRAWGSSSNSNKSFYLDNVAFEAKPCSQLQNLAAVPTMDGAEISWEQGADENRYQYCVVDAGAAADGWILLDEDVFSVTIEGKTLGNTYDCYVRSYCGANSQSEPLMVQFAPACVAPSALAASAVTNNSASLSWTSKAGQLRYKAEGEDWTNATINPAATTYALSNLNGSTTYTVQVQAACAANENEYWSDEFEFTTKCGLQNAANLPFTEDFTGIADYELPACWESATASVESEKLFFRGAEEQMVVLPGFNIEMNKLYVSFDYTLNNAKMQFGYVENLGGEFHSLAELEGTSYAAALSAEAVGFFAFRYYGATTEYAANTIDNFRVARVEIFSDTQNNQGRFEALKEEGKTIDVLFNRTLLGNGDYNTFCLPFSLDADQLAESPIANFKIKAFDYATIEGGELLIAIAPASSIEAGVPYFVANNANEANLTTQLFKDVVITADAPANVANGDVAFQGVFNPVDLAAQTGDVHNQLFLAAGNMIYWPAQNKTVKGFRAYFQVTTGNNSPIRQGMPARIVERQQMPTGFENLNSDIQSLKFIENGRVVILRNGVKYTIQGQVISK
jgi:hypothetical protein